MSEHITDSGKIKQDSRIPCKYGDKCYQKNPEHLSKYIHPPKKAKRKLSSKFKMSKKVKLDEEKPQTSNKQSTDFLEDSSTSNETSINQNDENKKETISSSDSEPTENTTIEQPKIISQEEDTRKESISSSDSEQNDPKDKNSLEDAASTATSNVLEIPQVDETNKSQTHDANEPFNPKKFIKSQFLVDVPEDFYYFWHFCKQLKPAAPSEALKDVGLELVGPYDVLAGKFKNIKRASEDYLRHWRYYYDPPEVLTVVKGDSNTGYHIGYFYDSPDAPATFLVSNYGIKDGVFSKMGDNIFTAISLYLEELKKIGDPFKKMRIRHFSTLIKNEAEKLHLNLSAHSKQIKERQFKVVAKTFNKIGLVVPYNKKTQLGYRELAIEDKELMILLNKLEKAAPEQKSKYLSDLQPVLTYANIALDECDFGTGVKLGWELLYHGIDSLNSTISQFLSNSYRFLNKESFAKIVEAHMSKRKKTCNLSVI